MSVIICTSNTGVMWSAGTRMVCFIVVEGLSDCSSTYRRRMVFCCSEKSAKLLSDMVSLNVTWLICTSHNILCFFLLVIHIGAVYPSSWLTARHLSPSRDTPKLAYLPYPYQSMNEPFDCVKCHLPLCNFVILHYSIALARLLLHITMEGSSSLQNAWSCANYLTGSLQWSSSSMSLFALAKT